MFTDQFFEDTPILETHIVWSGIRLFSYHNEKLYITLALHKDGRWGLLGGCHEPDQDASVLDTCIREVQEEGHIHVEKGKLKKTWSGKLPEFKNSKTTYHVYDHIIPYFEAEYIDGDEDVIKIRMFPLDVILSKRNRQSKFQIKYKDYLLIQKAEKAVLHREDLKKKINKLKKKRKGLAKRQSLLFFIPLQFFTKKPLHNNERNSEKEKKVQEFAQ